MKVYQAVSSILLAGIRPNCRDIVLLYRAPTPQLLRWPRIRLLPNFH